MRLVDGAEATKHLRELQRIADRNGGNRAAGTPGYEASVAYVSRVLRNVGFRVTRQSINFVESWSENSPPTLSITSPTPKTYAPGTDFVSFQPSPAGDVTAPVQAVDLTLPPTPTPTSTSGCEDSDFAGFVPGNIALIQRGTCPFIDKIVNATEAGASAVIVFNEGQPGRTDPTPLDLGEWRVVPMVYASFAVGSELAATPGVTVRLKVDSNLVLGTDDNVIAESLFGDPRNVVMVGGHLDSVPEGPGINDNGSGVAALLEVAEEMTGLAPVRNKIRFAFWAAEEIGLLGSDQYVDSLTAAQRDRIMLYLNFGMVASPNYATFLYDGDDSDAEGEPAGPAGSAQIEQRLAQFFQSRGLPTAGTDFDGRSDYGPFIEVGIPAGGIFTGAEGIKTPEEAALFGGTAGVAYDPCYHIACDTLANVNATALDVNADAIADSVARWAYSAPPQ